MEEHLMADEAKTVKAERDRQRAKKTKSNKSKAVNNVVELKTTPLIDNQELIVDMARFAEGLLDEHAIRKKYRLTDDVWQQAGSDDLLVRAIEAESVRRVRSGQLKRERAQALVVKGPGILDAIASDPSASPRHRVDAIKTLDGMAANPNDTNTPDASRFVISIVLNGDVTTYNKSLKPLKANERDPDDPDDVGSADVIAGVIATKVSTESGGGENTI